MSANVIVLGMTNALAAKLDSTGYPTIVADDCEARDRIECVLLPSMYGYVAGKGTQLDSFEDLGSIIKDFADGRSENAQEYLAILLRCILDYTRMSGEDFREARICCPCDFDRGVIAAAARDAGMYPTGRVPEFIDEREAVWAYCQSESALRHGNTLVCDLGGTRLDVYGLETDAPDGAIRRLFTDSDFGGRKWTDAMKQLLLDKIVEETGFTADELDDDALLEIENMADKVKQRLSVRDSTFRYVSVYDERYHIGVDRGEFERYTAEYVAEMLRKIEAPIAEADWDFERILLLGGSSRMPMIRRAMEQAFPDKEIICDNGTILAYGAVRAADAL